MESKTIPATEFTKDYTAEDHRKMILMWRIQQVKDSPYLNPGARVQMLQKLFEKLYKN